MSKLYSYDDSYDKEVPGKRALLLNFSGCKNNCKGCHSPHLQGDEGRILTGAYMQYLLKKYSKHIDVVCFLGGEMYIRSLTPLIKSRGLDIALYTGSEGIRDTYGIRYLKTGAYDAERGPLTSPTTNQRMIDLETETDITWRFWGDS